MAICLNCRGSLEWSAATCPACHAVFGPTSAWRPLPDNEWEEAQQLQREPALRAGEVAADALPDHWQVKSIDDGVRLRHAPAYGWVVGVLGIGALVAGFIGAVTAVHPDSEENLGLFMFVVMFLIPASVVATVAWPMLRGGRTWEIFPSGLVTLRGRWRWRRKLVELGVPVSIMVEPLESSNINVAAAPDDLQRLVLRGPRGRLPIINAERAGLLALRDEIRRQLHGPVRGK